MPPPNPHRRDLLADAAIEVLARDGSRGLTHRVVDAAAGVPPGTTSRYFRSREALLNGVVDRVMHRVGEQIDVHAAQPLDPARLEDALATVLHQLLTVDRSQPLALFELHLESNRNPHLRHVLTEATTARRDLIVRKCRAAGVEVSERDALLVEMTVLGILFTALTAAPGAGDDVGSLIRTGIGGILARYERRSDPGVSS